MDIMMNQMSQRFQSVERRSSVKAKDVLHHAAAITDSNPTRILYLVICIVASNDSSLMWLPKPRCTM